MSSDSKGPANDADPKSDISRVVAASAETPENTSKEVKLTLQTPESQASATVQPEAGDEVAHEPETPSPGAATATLERPDNLSEEFPGGESFPSWAERPETEEYRKPVAPRRTAVPPLILEPASSERMTGDGTATQRKGSPEPAAQPAASGGKGWKRIFTGIGIVAVIAVIAVLGYLLYAEKSAHGQMTAQFEAEKKAKENQIVLLQQMTEKRDAEVRLKEASMKSHAAFRADMNHYVAQTEHEQKMMEEKLKNVADYVKGVKEWKTGVMAVMTALTEKNKGYATDLTQVRDLARKWLKEKEADRQGLQKADEYIVWVSGELVKFKHALHVTSNRLSRAEAEASSGGGRGGFLSRLFGG